MIRLPPRRKFYFSSPKPAHKAGSFRTALAAVAVLAPSVHRFPRRAVPRFSIPLRAVVAALALFVFASLCAPLFAEQSTVLVKKNEYGGQTLRLVYESGDVYYDQLVSSVYYFDANNEACRVIHTFNETQALLSGFSVQEERLDGGKVLNYRMTLTTKQRIEQGIDYLIEYMGKENTVIRREFISGNKSMTEATGTFTDSYPFYALDVLEKYLQQDDTQEIQNDRAVYKFSATFNRGRSFVTFDSGLRNISDSERSMIVAYMDCYNQKEDARQFTKKVTVSYGKQTYTAFIPQHLLSYVKRKRNCVLTYRVALCNGKQVLLVTAVNNLD